MRVIPGTHHGSGFSDYEPVDPKTHVFRSRIKPGQFDESKAVNLEIKSGECHVHHARLIHGSEANKSPKRRCGYTMRYMPTSVKFHTESIKWKRPHVIYLARGRDLAGNQYGDPTKSVM